MRAVLEGVVFDLRHSLDCFAAIGLPIDELRIGEGGSHSEVWRQVQADILGRDVVRIATDDLSAVGAALLAGVGGGLYADFATALPAHGQAGRDDPLRPSAGRILSARF